MKGSKKDRLGRVKGRAGKEGEGKTRRNEGQDAGQAM